MTTNIAHIVDEHIAMWNSPAGEKRGRSIASVYATSVRVAEPDAVHHGHAGVAQAIDALESVPGMQIRLTSPRQTAQDLTTYSWAFGPEGGQPEEAPGSRREVPGSRIRPTRPPSGNGCRWLGEVLRRNPR